MLDALAAGTGGRSFGVGDNQPGLIEAAMVEINAEVRGGIITTEPVHFPDAKADDLDKLLASLLDYGKGRAPPRSRPKLEAILKVAGVKTIGDLLKKPGKLKSRLTGIPVDVEEENRSCVVRGGASEVRERLALSHRSRWEGRRHVGRRLYSC